MNSQFFLKIAAVIGLVTLAVVVVTRWQPASSAVQALGARAIAPLAKPVAPEVSFLFGIINDDGLHYQDEWSRGVRATTFELQWRLYEPQPGMYDTDYINHMQGILNNLKAAGWTVQLVPGYHYVPGWVFDQHPDMYYVNQYGDAYSPDPMQEASRRVINAPFNSQARALIAGYLAQLFQDFDPALFDSIRVGGSVQGELRFPPPDWNGRSNSYWAFDGHAQNPAESGIPATVIGWRPGLDQNPGSVNRGQMLVNPGFEQTHSYYPVPAWSPDDEVSAQPVASGAHSGDRALQLQITTPHRAHQFVRVDGNTTYELSAWLRTTDPASQARLFANQYNANHQLVSGAPWAKLESNATTWAQAAGSLITAADTRFLKIELDGDRPGTYYFDDLFLSRQNPPNNLNRDIDVPLAFYDWYVDTLTAYQNWQIDQLRLYFSGQLDVLFAGKGVRANQVTAALTNDLWGDGWSEDSRALYSAGTYDRHVDGLSSTNSVTLYLTGIETPPPDQVDDSSPFPGRWSAARWISFLAQQRGLSTWGENGGQNNLAEMQLSFERMFQNNFLGLMWAFESELYASPNPNGYASIDSYSGLIQQYSDLDETFLPLIQD